MGVGEELSDGVDVPVGVGVMEGVWLKELLAELSELSEALSERIDEGLTEEVTLVEMLLIEAVAVSLIIGVFVFEDPPLAVGYTDVEGV